ncbi:cinnamoyl-CoA reductase [Penicillium atrosanguineum]|uniref:Cinnamoyl-CoA reductase n=1 Tax=Penicillium atrosanguineum TaxID=1132637 RepID=A0A9W9HIZ3_9EURO|nr:PQ loop repeat protein [Penicillium atrosanguineum]KAJ5149267.1 cinnamoyl-CoA reductase [Penicillium atrosanguineum]KAJ5304580.1 PQ loop repeat protein [Penicillium atrosanguineum]KAJ5324049.1 cinnamoyl-CoA reductase [Penicillium atrosanguineum]
MYCAKLRQLGRKFYPEMYRSTLGLTRTLLQGSNIILNFPEEWLIEAENVAHLYIVGVLDPTEIRANFRMRRTNAQFFENSDRTIKDGGPLPNPNRDRTETEQTSF